jgi:hypothetical protein
MPNHQWIKPRRMVCSYDETTINVAKLLKSTPISLGEDHQQRPKQQNCETITWS